MSHKKLLNFFFKEVSFEYFFKFSFKLFLSNILIQKHQALFKLCCFNSSLYVFHPIDNLKKMLNMFSPYFLMHISLIRSTFWYQLTTERKKVKDKIIQTSKTASFEAFCCLTIRISNRLFFWGGIFLAFHCLFSFSLSFIIYRLSEIAFILHKEDHETITKDFFSLFCDRYDFESNQN